MKKAVKARTNEDRILTDDVQRGSSETKVDNYAKYATTDKRRDGFKPSGIAKDLIVSPPEISRETHRRNGIATFLCVPNCHGHERHEAATAYVGPIMNDTVSRKKPRRHAQATKSCVGL